MEQLSNAALGVINQYLALPFKQGGVQTPYYNNERIKLRAGLRVLVGKGSPADIIEEALIISLHDKMQLNSLSSEETKKFLIDHKIGIDCSGLAYYILDAEVRSRELGSLAGNLRFPLIRNPFRKLLALLRPAENTNVASLAHPANSKTVELTDLKPGDLILLRNTGKDHKLQHLLLVHAVEKDTVPKIFYTHSFAWQSEGRYGHGVRQGSIALTAPGQSILDQTWVEKGESGETNETFLHARLAERLELRRLNILE